MEQTMKVVVLGANRYNFEDEKTGKTIEGCKVHYINVGTTEEENVTGSIPKAENMPYKYFNELGQVPGVYNAKVQFNMNGRKIVAKIVEFKFVEAVTFELPVKA
jgi:hypothetical protein